jgi:hypothetical protein
VQALIRATEAGELILTTPTLISATSPANAP